MACGCGCGTPMCSCNVNCADVCTAIQIQNSFNLPACNQTAVLTVPGLKNIVVGAYLWNPTYGYFLVSSFNGITGQIIVTNLCSSGNAAPGTIVPQATMFTVAQPPISNLIDYSATIVFSATGAMTFTANSITSAKYSRIGPKLIWFEVDVIGTTAGVASYGIIHTLPAAAAASSTGAGVAAAAVDGALLSGAALFTDPTHSRVSKYDSSSFGLGAARRIITGGIYEAA